MHFAHLLYLVKVNNEASFVSVVLLNTFPTENSKMIGTIEVLHSLVMFVTQETLDAFFIFKVNISKDTVSLHDFI